MTPPRSRHAPCPLRLALRPGRDGHGADDSALRLVAWGRRRGGLLLHHPPQSVDVGPYARILGGVVTGDARIEDQDTVVNGTVSGGTIGALSLIGVAAGPGAPASSFDVSDAALMPASAVPVMFAA